MKTLKLILAASLAAAGVTTLVAPHRAEAQSTTTGAITGVVTDGKTGEKLVGVTVVATSSALQGTQTAITDENGQYKIDSLPPGSYIVTFYYADITLKRDGVNVGIQKTTPVFQKLNSGDAGGEVVQIHDTAPTIDPTSTNQGITIDQNYTKNIPVPGRTFEATLGAAAGSQGDGVGVSFSGSSSLENQYYVDGVNTTGLTFGTVGSPVINDFIEEIEVITGGYNAEFGRATGGVVNVVTKSGSNEFKGSVFGYYSPGQLTAARQVTPVNAASIDVVGNSNFAADFGFDLGGPIIKDKLWFYVGFAPQFGQTDYTRTTKRQRDCQLTLASGQLSTCNPKSMSAGGFADGNADVDPKTGFYITDKLDQETRSATGSSYSTLAKLNYAASPEQQGQIALIAQPSSSRSPGIYGLANTGFVTSGMTTDLSGKWTSKFNDNKTEVEAVVGWHRDTFNADSIDPATQNDPRQILFNGNLGVWSGLGGESNATKGGCTDGGTGDPYPNITNCPMTSRSYTIGGPGGINRDTEERRSAKLALTERLKAAGTHEIKAGLDAEDNISDKARLFSGGGFVQNFTDANLIRVTRWVQLQPDTATDPTYNNECTTPDPAGGKKPLSFKCRYLGGTIGGPGTQITGNTFNWSAYLRDSWQIQPNLTLNVGMRYEEQRLRYAKFLQNTVDPLTQENLGTNAMSLTGLWAPRVGLIYDWTKEGRSKIYANYGRYYESIPMDINDRSFGGEVTFQQDYNTTATPAPCGPVDPNIGAPNGAACVTNGKPAGTEKLIGASGVLVAPGIKPQYMDEIVGGVEYELMDDLKVGLAYKHRTLGRVIEDVSTDGASTYIITNPGEWSQEDQTNLENKIAMTDDPKLKAKLQNQLTMFKGIRMFDKPERNYNALEFTVTRRFSKALYIQGSYTFSRTTGNYPGLISYDNGQIDPNISSQFDLIELLANRKGPLPTDRPHYIKLDGYYTFDLKKAGQLTTGIRARALSGIPENALGAHYLYGPDESFLLPRGQLGRTDFDHSIDLHLGFGRKLNKGMNLELFFDVFNIYNRQGTNAIDETYAPSARRDSKLGTSGSPNNVNPISGGTYEDLIWAKTLDGNGKETSVPTARNPNFGNTIVRYAPSSARIGLRLTF